MRAKGQEDGGPPPWVPFGQKIQPLAESLEKSLEEKNKAVKDEEFLNQRQEAIAAAVDVSSGVNKVIKGSGRYVNWFQVFVLQLAFVKSCCEMIQMEIQKPEKRSRGRGRRERDHTSRAEERALTRPPNSIRLFEFLEPQIGAEAEEERHDDEAEADEEDEQLSWERDGIYRPPRGRAGRGRSRGRGDSYDERDHDRRGSRGSHYESDTSYRGRRGGSRGRGGYHNEEDSGHHSRGRRGSYRDRGHSGRGGPNSYGRREDSYSSGRAKSIENLVEDFAAWPGLAPAPQDAAGRPSSSKPQAEGPKLDQWAVDDYCLAKWESTEQYYPAVIQQLIPNRKSVTVMFVESGAVRIVETKHLRRDPQDTAGPSSAPPSRGHRSSRIYTPRHRGGAGIRY